MESLQYPIGRFQYKGPYTEAERNQLIQTIAETPAKFRDAVKTLSSEQLETPYRPGGWTVRQVVNHVADSHMHAFTRYKLALTEDTPTIKPYDQDKWVNLPDTLESPLELSLSLIHALHQKWVILLKSLSDKDFQKSFMHPENGLSSLDRVLGLYAWHSAHHLAHITSLTERQGW